MIYSSMGMSMRKEALDPLRVFALRRHTELFSCSAQAGIAGFVSIKEAPAIVAEVMCYDLLIMACLYLTGFLSLWDRTGCSSSVSSAGHGTIYPASAACILMCSLMRWGGADGGSVEAQGSLRS